MIIKDNEGDWGIVVGSWNEFRKGVPGDRSKHWMNTHWNYVTRLPTRQVYGLIMSHVNRASSNYSLHLCCSFISITMKTHNLRWRSKPADFKLLKLWHASIALGEYLHEWWLRWRQGTVNCGPFVEVTFKHSLIVSGEAKSFRQEFLSGKVLMFSGQLRRGRKPAAGEIFLFASTS